MLITVAGCTTTAHVGRGLANVADVVKAKRQDDKRRSNVGTKPKVSDETILAMRYMYEIDGKPFKDVCAKFSEIDPRYVRKVLAYEMRLYLVPKLK